MVTSHWKAEAGTIASSFTKFHLTSLTKTCFPTLPQTIPNIAHIEMYLSAFSRLEIAAEIASQKWSFDVFFAIQNGLFKAAGIKSSCK